jgi:hypothetical protein
MGTVPRGSMWRRRTIDGVHPGATAKIARQVAAHEDAHGLIVIPVDMRQFPPGLRTTAGATSTISLPVEGDEEWTDVHARILAAMNEHRYLAQRADPSALDVPPSLNIAITRWGDDLGGRECHGMRRAY